MLEANREYDLSMVCWFYFNQLSLKIIFQGPFFTLFCFFSFPFRVLYYSQPMLRFLKSLDWIKSFDLYISQHNQVLRVDQIGNFQV